MKDCTNENNSELAKQISAFISSIDAYRRIANSLPISDGLTGFHGKSCETEAALASIEQDSTAVDVRMMLQRKYFCHKEVVNVAKLLRKATEVHEASESYTGILLKRITSINDSPIVLSLSDGSSFRSKYEIAEKIIYGFYLHADIDKIQPLMNLSPQMKLMATAPYILEREAILFDAYDLFISLGYSPFSSAPIYNAGMLSASNQLNEDHSISSSPFWSNFFGRDASDEELSSIARKNSIDDNIVLMIANKFFQMLRDDHFDSNDLRHFVWSDFWEDWNDFSEGHAVAASIPNPGFSSKVSHEGGSQYAQVKILPNVEAPWITSTPQLIEADIILILLTNRKGIWKVNGIASPST